MARRGIGGVVSLARHVHEVDPPRQGTMLQPELSQVGVFD